MWKKVVSLFLIITMLFSLSGCANVLGGAFFLFLVATSDDRADKDAVITFVCEHEKELLQSIENEDFSAFENNGFIRQVNADDKVVDFFCGGAGVGSGTSYVGFYYTPENDMAAIWCAPPSADYLTPSGDGYTWKSRDNRYYTEHICGNFYYYEATF